MPPERVRPGSAQNVSRLTRPHAWSRPLRRAASTFAGTGLPSPSGWCARDDVLNCAVGPLLDNGLLGQAHDLTGSKRLSHFPKQACSCPESRFSAPTPG